MSARSSRGRQRSIAWVASWSRSITAWRARPPTSTSLRFGEHRISRTLAKLGRNQDYDREDVRRLARGAGLDVAILEQRYRDELRWQLGNPERDDLTLELWIAMIRELSPRLSDPPADRRQSPADCASPFARAHGTLPPGFRPAPGHGSTAKRTGLPSRTGGRAER
jgi:hypothetical protein